MRSPLLFDKFKLPTCIRSSVVPGGEQQVETPPMETPVNETPVNETPVNENPVSNAAIPAPAGPSPAKKKAEVTGEILVRALER
eukprot:4407666-Prymnesium_polylepis.1